MTPLADTKGSGAIPALPPFGNDAASSARFRLYEGDIQIQRAPDFAQIITLRLCGSGLLGRQGGHPCKLNPVRRWSGLFRLRVAAYGYVII